MSSQLRGREPIDPHRLSITTMTVAQASAFPPKSPSDLIRHDTRPTIELRIAAVAYDPTMHVGAKRDWPPVVRLVVSKRRPRSDARLCAGARCEGHAGGGAESVNDDTFPRAALDCVGGVLE
jgi:hypothetical protein